MHKTMISRSGLSMRVFPGEVRGSENSAVEEGIKSEIGRC